MIPKNVQFESFFRNFLSLIMKEIIIKDKETELMISVNKYSIKIQSLTLMQLKVNASIYILLLLLTQNFKDFFRFDFECAFRCNAKKTFNKE